MVRTWVAAAAAAGGIVVGALLGPAVVGSVASPPATPADSDSRLGDRIAVEDLITSYYENFGSTDAAEQFGTYYTEDAVFDVNGIVSTGRKEIEGLYASMGEESDAPARQGTFHMIISNPVITATKLAEFSRKQPVTPSRLISRPAMAGPTMRAALNSRLRVLGFTAESSGW